MNLLSQPYNRPTSWFKRVDDKKKQRRLLTDQQNALGQSETTFEQIQHVDLFWQAVLAKFPPRPHADISRIMGHLAKARPLDKPSNTSLWKLAKEFLDMAISQGTTARWADNTTLTLVNVDFELFEALRIIGDNSHGYGTFPTTLRQKIQAAGATFLFAIPQSRIVPQPWHQWVTTNNVPYQRCLPLHSTSIPTDETKKRKKQEDKVEFNVVQTNDAVTTNKTSTGTTSQPKAAPTPTTNITAPMVPAPATATKAKPTTSAPSQNAATAADIVQKSNTIPQDNAIPQRLVPGRIDIAQLLTTSRPNTANRTDPFTLLPDITPYHQLMTNQQTNQAAGTSSILPNLRDPAIPRTEQDSTSIPNEKMKWWTSTEQFPDEAEALRQLDEEFDGPFTKRRRLDMPLSREDTPFFKPAQEQISISAKDAKPKVLHSILKPTGYQQPMVQQPTVRQPAAGQPTVQQPTVQQPTVTVQQPTVKTEDDPIITKINDAAHPIVVEDNPALRPFVVVNEKAREQLYKLMNRQHEDIRLNDADFSVFAQAFKDAISNGPIEAQIRNIVHEAFENAGMANRRQLHKTFENVLNNRSVKKYFEDMMTKTAQRVEKTLKAHFTSEVQKWAATDIQQPNLQSLRQEIQDLRNEIETLKGQGPKGKSLWE